MEDEKDFIPITDDEKLKRIGLYLSKDLITVIKKDAKKNGRGYNRHIDIVLRGMYENELENYKQ